MPDAAMSATMSAETCRLVCAQVADALIYADRDGRIQLWNSAAQALFGFTAEEALGQSLDLIIPPQLRAAHWEGFDRALASGATRLGHRVMMTRALNRAGAATYVEMSFAVVNAADGSALGAVAMARDASAHRELTRTLRVCQAELSARSAEPPAP